jgi:hypothetical protein
LEDLLGGLLASFAVPARMKKPLDFDVASNPHNALLETEEPAYDHPSQLSSSSRGAAAATTAVTLPHVAHGHIFSRPHARSAMSFPAVAFSVTAGIVPAGPAFAGLFPV